MTQDIRRENTCRSSALAACALDSFSARQVDGAELVEASQLSGDVFTETVVGPR
jgi:hypothetical protein